MEQTMKCPDYYDKNELGNPKREGYYDELLQGEVITELFLRSKEKNYVDFDPYEQEASIIMHLQSYVGMYDREVKREIKMVIEGKKKHWKPETIRHHREMAIYNMEMRDRDITRVKRRKAELIEAIRNGIELELPRRINDGR